MSAANWMVGLARSGTESVPSVSTEDFAAQFEVLEELGLGARW